MKLGFNALMENKSFLLGMSVITSMLVWFTVVYGIDTNTTQIIHNVPVAFDIEDSALARQGLEPVTLGSFAVDVEVFGPRAVVGNVKPGDILIKANLNNVNAAGTFELTLIGSDAKRMGFEVRSTTPETIPVRFDTMTERTLPVVLETTNLEVPEGYVLSQEYIYPARVTVRGPSTEMAQLDRCEVQLSFTAPITTTGTYDSPIVLLDASDLTLNSPYLSVDVPTASVTLPVLKRKTVPVTLGYVNVPQGFTLDILGVVTTPDSIEVAGPAPGINNFHEMHLGYLDLRTLRPGADLYYPVSLPAGFISVESVQEINVSFKGEGFSEKLLNVTDIRLINQPASYEVAVQTKTIYGVTVYGPEESVSQLTARDLVAQIDMTDIDNRTGNFTVPVSILLPNSTDCWAYGTNHTAVISIRSRA